MWRRTWPLGVLLLATACGAMNAGDGVQCTTIGTPVGVSVDVAHPDVTSGTIEVCWDTTCATPTLKLYPSSEVAATTCTGTAPDDSCSASVEPTEGTNGFASLPELPAKPVTATLRLLDQSGSVLVDRKIPLSPEMVYPNGPNCPAGGPQAGISVGADGAVTER
ncbi:hypothetical protein ALI22I_04205 [Saccharothrix sp. ALI-22-I]|uniref:hypothetical protein n=1 Tax=Saccharothrix sp. ALI-22-I TaxID=1933778 RepID=UPI00097CA7AF|nr:hypothetical protein [Saccharothrix sp. ALI-22-I]ONI92351.1 hypothetical protein ALI22I_04205 [Saccharothrix sp. ALI-22-I]